MNHEKWYRVDNAAKVFLATHNQRDTRSLRFSCSLRQPVIPELLSEALSKTIKARNIFQVRIRKGMFWHYIEPTNVLPEVTEEFERPCPVLYGKNYHGVLHYKVTYFGDRINFDIFHALTDATGALDFLNILVLNYLKLRYPDELSDVSVGFSAADSELEQDSFSKFYEKKDIPAVSFQKAYHIRGVRLPYDQLQFFRVSLPADRIKSASKEAGVGITSYIGAKLMMAIYRDMPALKRNLPVTVSVPVNLRNYYETETARNFFNSVSVSHVFSGKESFEELAKEFEAELKQNLEPESIRRHMNHYQKIERIMALRIVPLVIKQPVVRSAARKDARGVSAVISNLGVIRVPDELKKYISGYTLYCSHSELYMSLCTYNGRIVMGITAGLRNTNVLRDFVSGFAKECDDAEVQATEVVRS